MQFDMANSIWQIPVSLYSIMFDFTSDLALLFG